MINLPKSRPAVRAIMIGAVVALLLLSSRGIGRLCNGGSCYGVTDVAKTGRPGAPSLQVDSSAMPGQNPMPGPQHKCSGFPDVSNILLVMKTGASEALSNIPVQLLTNLKCLDDFLIFSDMAQDIAGYSLLDSLDTVLPSVKNSSTDFDLYFQQQECTVDQKKCDENVDVKSMGWSLDKYKNIHIAEKSYHLRPNYDWYLFVDADTYVIWPTVAEWLRQIDPLEPHYIGSHASYLGFLFAHGGSGYLVSQAAMQSMFDGRTNVANKYDPRAPGVCCGDYLFAHALFNETGTPVTNVWPTINGEMPFTLEYGEEQWCQPIATMHHIGPEVVSDFDEFEMARGFEKPMLIKEIFREFVLPRLERYMIDWNNYIQDVLYVDPDLFDDLGDGEKSMTRTGEDMNEAERDAWLSPQHCLQLCESSYECLQWVHHDGRCALGRKIAYGEPQDFLPGMASSQRWVSGWHLDAIQAWAEENDDCGEVEWPWLPPQGDQGDDGDDEDDADLANEDPVDGEAV